MVGAGGIPSIKFETCVTRFLGFLGGHSGHKLPLGIENNRGEKVASKYVTQIPAARG
jgi:hypothetical protein